MISNLPTKNIDPQIVQVDQMKKKVRDLDAELRQANAHIGFLTQMNDEKDQKIEYLENKVRNLNKITEDNNGILQKKLHEQKQLHDEEKAMLIIHKDNFSSPHGREDERLPDIGMPTTKEPLSAAYVNTQGGDDDGANNQMRRSFSPNKTFQTNGSGFGKGTMTNFYFQQDKQKQDAAAERLIHSVNAVTDLLKANTNLRTNIEVVQRDLEEKEAEGFQFNIENQALRERLELVEGILKNNS